MLGRFLDADESKARVSEARLLARTDDQQGRFFSFGGYAPRRYSTWAILTHVDEDTDTAALVLPEWHPSRPLHLPHRLIPARDPGAWMTCRADLSVGRAAQLDVSDLRLCPDPGERRCHRPAYQAPAPRPPAAVPVAGRRCGDIVLESPQPPHAVYEHVGGLLDIHVPDRPAGIAAGGRVYLAAPASTITTYLTIRQVRQSPNGTFLVCDPQPQRVATEVPMPDGDRVRHRWRWRWWPRELDSNADTPLEAFADYPYDRIEHMGEYVVKARPLATG